MFKTKGIKYYRRKRKAEAISNNEVTYFKELAKAQGFYEISFFANRYSINSLEVLPVIFKQVFKCSGESKGFLF
ncbi:MAG: hypothetical protein ACOX4L_06370 [Bacillota bacterium]|jgi:hypothetical protein